MNEPFGGKVNPRLVQKRFKNCVFYYTSDRKGEESAVVPCLLEYAYNMLMIRPFNKEWKLENYRRPFDWENMFLDYEEANKQVKEKSNRISAFRHKPFLDHKILKKHFEVLKKTETLIDKLLSGFENYGGIDFCDVHAGGIQVRIHHNSIKGYTYGNQKTILYDFSNIEDIPIEVVKEFIRIDEPEAILKEKQFIAYGEKYGWD